MSTIRSRLAPFAIAAAVPCVATPLFAADAPAGSAAPASATAAAPAAAAASTVQPAAPGAQTASASSPGAAAPAGVLAPASVTGASPATEAPQGLGIGASAEGSRASELLRMVLETGRYRCELSRDVTIRSISPDRQTMVISWMGKEHTLNAVGTNTGAMRYENAADGLVWLVILGKSMLLDSKKGQQLANECKL